MTLFHQPPSIYSNITSTSFCDSMLKCSYQKMKRYSPSGQHYPDPSLPQESGTGEITQQQIQDGSKRVKTAQSFESLFDSETLSDVILNINDGQILFNGHKMIIGMKSEVLASLLNETGSIDADDNRPVLNLKESEETVFVFSRFLYFIYSGAVWLHRDYVVQLHQLAIKYDVRSLLQHCESYVSQILNNMTGMSENARGFAVDTVCDLFENTNYPEEVHKLCFRVLCAKFKDLVNCGRWHKCSWTLVCDLLRSDDCNSEENFILTSATDWMKKNRLSDKCLIEDILTKIRYPQLHRRVLFHLNKHSAFKNFPQVQALVENAVQYHCFKDLPEAKDEYNGLQYVPRQCPPPIPSRAPSVESVHNHPPSFRSCHHNHHNHQRTTHSLLSHSVLVQNNQPVNYATITGQINRPSVIQNVFDPTMCQDLPISANIHSQPLVMDPIGHNQPNHIVHYSALNHTYSQPNGYNGSRPASRNHDPNFINDNVNISRPPSRTNSDLSSNHSNELTNGLYETINDSSLNNINPTSPQKVVKPPSDSQNQPSLNSSSLSRSHDSTNSAIQQTLLNMSTIDNMGNNSGTDMVVVQLPPKTKTSKIPDLGMTKTK